VLFSEFEVGLTWDWFVANPNQWTIQSSVDGSTEWEDLTTVAAADRLYAPPGPADLFYRIAGIDAGSNLVTQWSNVVELITE
jgi:hypothetical protein